MFSKKVALKIELFAFRYYIIYVTWISYIMTENERKLADLIVNYDRHIADAQEYALQILAAKEYLDDRLPTVFVKL